MLTETMTLSEASGCLFEAIRFLPGHPHGKPWG